MKSFFLTSLLFFAFICSFARGFAQEHSSPPQQEVLTPDQNQQESHRYLDNQEVPNVMVDHVERESDTFQAKFFNMLFVLCLLIGFMILASWALKRMMRTKVTQMNISSNIKILETRYLSPRATLYLVEVLDHVYLIGESPTSVNFLATIPSDAEKK